MRNFTADSKCLLKKKQKKKTWSLLYINTLGGLDKGKVKTNSNFYLMLHINIGKPRGMMLNFSSLMEMQCKLYVYHPVFLFHMCVLTKAFDNVKMSEVPVIASFL